MNAAIDIRQFSLANGEYSFDLIDEVPSVTALIQDSIVLEIPDFVEIKYGQLNQIALADDEYISDVIDDIPNGKTLIQAGTGFGKTKFVMETLTKRSQCLLMLVPSVAQVQQLEALYPRNDIVYLYGASTAQPNDPLKGKHIIATFDKLSNIRKELGDELLGKEYMLIIDETHKVWAAGSYRDGAINPILAAIRNRNLFQKIGLLTATFTDEFAELAQLKVDTKIEFTKENILQRKVCIKVYEKPDPYYWLQYVMRRVSFVKTMGLESFVLVRLNSKRKQEELKSIFGERDISALFINSDTIGQEDIQNALKNEALPTKYQVIVTTSIFDEALNFKNTDRDIDSVHIVNGVAHPEEVVQFLGRFREASPQVFIHLQNAEELYLAPNTEAVAVAFPDQATLVVDEVKPQCTGWTEPTIANECVSHASIDEAQQALDVFCMDSYQSYVSQIDAENLAELAAEPSDIADAIEMEADSYHIAIDECQAALDELEQYQSEMKNIHAKNFSSIKSYYERIKAFCHTFQEMIQHHKPNWKAKDKLKFVQEMNQTCKEHLQCRFLTLDRNNNIRVNDASLLANCYRMDIGAVYSKDINYLGWRLQRLLPSIDLVIDDVSVSRVDMAGLTYLSERVEYYENQHYQRLQNALCRVHTDTLTRWIDTYRADNLAEFGKKQMCEQEQTVLNIYSSTNEPDHYVQYERLIRLTQHLEKLDDICLVIKNDYFERVLGLSADYRSNLIVQNLQRCIQTKWTEHKLSNGQGADFKIDKALALELVNNALALTVKAVPDLTIILRTMPHSGIKWDEESNAFISRTEAKAMNMICKYCHVEEKNVNKPDKRYLILKGIYFGGYGYLSAAASRSQTCPTSTRVGSVADLYALTGQTPPTDPYAL